MADLTWKWKADKPLYTIRRHQVACGVQLHAFTGAGRHGTLTVISERTEYKILL